MPVKLTAAQMLDRWKTGVQGAQGRYTAGIQNSGDWAAASIAAAPQRNAGLLNAINNGSIDRGIESLGTQRWRDITRAKGPANWLAGVTNASDKYLRGASKLIGMLQNADAAIASMPRGTYEQNKARLNAYLDSVHEQKMSGG